MTHRCLTSLVMLNGVDVPSNSNSPVMIKKKKKKQAYASYIFLSGL